MHEQPIINEVFQLFLGMEMKIHVPPVQDTKLVNTVH